MLGPLKDVVMLKRSSRMHILVSAVSTLLTWLEFEELKGRTDEAEIELGNEAVKRTDWTT